MHLKGIPYTDLIRLDRNEALPHIFDVRMQNVQQLAPFDSVECHLVLYPYSRRIGADHFQIHPFSGYMREVNRHGKSCYMRIPETADKLAGLALALSITALCMLFKPDLLLRVEVLVSIMGAYFLGRDFWGDTETHMINMLAGLRLSYRKRYYSFRLEKNTTLVRYSDFARKKRYGYSEPLPEWIDHIVQNNSQTLRMWFSGGTISGLKEESIQLCAIHFPPALLEPLEAEGFLFGVKMSFNRRWGPFTKRMEMFQSLSKGTRGCLDAGQSWRENDAYVREVLSLGQFRFLRKDAVIPSVCMLELT